MKNNKNPFLCKKHHKYQGKYRPRGACDPCWMMYIWAQHDSGSLSDFVYGLVRRGFETNPFNPIVNMGTNRKRVTQEAIDKWDAEHPDIGEPTG